MISIDSYPLFKETILKAVTELDLVYESDLEDTEKQSQLTKTFMQYMS